VYFGDQAANMYAVDADSGKTLWKVRVEDASRAGITASPQLYEGILYVPVSSREESAGGDLRYPCCTFRGSLVALDAATGKQIWKTYVVAEEPKPTEKNRIGTQLWGPSGGAVWNTPTIDIKRSVLYVGTGNNYSPPATRATDAAIAVDLKSGRIVWVHQFTANDIWNTSCLARGDQREQAVCPDANAPDSDFASSPVLVELKNGRQLLLVANKSGMIWALDPDQQGKTIWTQSIGKGSLQGGVLWGFGVDADKAYVPNGYFDAANPDASGAMTAVDLNDGRMVWRSPNPPCADRTPCKPSHVAAVTVMTDVVFSGTLDGHLYAYSTEDGRILLDLNTARDYSTVNGVRANGGSLSNAGPTIVNGILYVNSGYSHHGGITPGNVLLAFSVEE
jgi:polyvinyl alcohol dehydrogenase (cytochrome)